MPLTELPPTLPYEVSHDFLWVFATWEDALHRLAQTEQRLPWQEQELQRLRLGYPPRAWVGRLRYDELLRLIRRPAADHHPLLAAIGILEFADRYRSLLAEQIAEVRRIWGESERGLFRRRSHANVRLALTEDELRSMAMLTGRV